MTKVEQLNTEIREGENKLWQKTKVADTLRLSENWRINMNSVESKKLLRVTFDGHMFMKDRDYHTINELMYVLEHDDRFKGTDFNISISTLDESWCSIPCLDAFVDIKTRGLWFDDDAVEFDIDEL